LPATGIVFNIAKALAIVLVLTTPIAGVSTPALAQSPYPHKPIRLIVGFPPGGGIDFTARAIQPAPIEALKQQVLIDYKPGAGGLLAATEVMRAAPDGYTVLLANTGPFAIAPHLQAKKPTAGFPPEVMKKLGEALATVLAQAEVKARFAAAGSDVRERSSTDFAQYVAAENDKWANVIRKGNIRLD
jgi:tripartite-type tricarboxylate transporter receptor subunit TctC